MSMDAAYIEQLVACAVAKATAELRAEIVELKAELAATKAELAATKAELAATKAELAKTKDELARARKDSGNSSKPGSTDFFKQAEADEEDKSDDPPATPPAGGQAKEPPKKRKIGGQPGHVKHVRPKFTDDQIAKRKAHTFSDAEIAARGLQFKGWKTTYQVELPADPVITEHTRALYWDPKRKRHVLAPWRNSCDAGLLSPRMMALAAWMHAAMHASYENIKRFFDCVFGLKVSDGLLAKAIRGIGDILEKADSQLVALLPAMLKLNIDETGHKRNGALLWCWIFVAEKFTVIRTGLKREAKVLTRFLGELYAGLIHCDYFSSYRSFAKTATKARFQFCLAHLVRDLRFVAQHPDEKASVWGKGMLALIRQILRARKAGKGDPTLVETLLVLVEHPPDQKEARNIAKRLRDHTAHFTRFMEDKAAETTNNRAERALRPTVLHRKATQGTRSEAGDRTHERLQTVLATCAQQGVSAFRFFMESLIAHRKGRAMPSLVAAA